MEDHNRDEEIPGVSEFEALSPEQAFDSLALEVPELLRLRERVAPFRRPIHATQTAEEFQQQLRDRQRGGLFNARARQSRKERLALHLELSRLVGPRAAHGSDLVRSNAALLTCSAFLFASPWDSDSQ
jgi:hypothetical protein